MKIAGITARFFDWPGEIIAGPGASLLVVRGEVSLQIHRVMQESQHFDYRAGIGRREPKHDEVSTLASQSRYVQAEQSLEKFTARFNAANGRPIRKCFQRRRKRFAIVDRLLGAELLTRPLNNVFEISLGSR
nr:hypothetical protein [Steroidobacter sp.]